jgi:hypothetical protein
MERERLDSKTASGGFEMNYEEYLEARIERLEKWRWILLALIVIEGVFWLVSQ